MPILNRTIAGEVGQVWIFPPPPRQQTRQSIQPFYIESSPSSSTLRVPIIPRKKQLMPDTGAGRDRRGKYRWEATLWDTCIELHSIPRISVGRRNLGGGKDFPTSVHFHYFTQFLEWEMLRRVFTIIPYLPLTPLRRTLLRTS